MWNSSCKKDGTKGLGGFRNKCKRKGKKAITGFKTDFLSLLTFTQINKLYPFPNPQFLPFSSIKVDIFIMIKMEMIVWFGVKK